MRGCFTIISQRYSFLLRIAKRKSYFPFYKWFWSVVWHNFIPIYAWTILYSQLPQLNRSDQVPIHSIKSIDHFFEASRVGSSFLICILWLLGSPWLTTNGRQIYSVICSFDWSDPIGYDCFDVFGLTVRLWIFIGLKRSIQCDS